MNQSRLAWLYKLYVVIDVFLVGSFTHSIINRDFARDITLSLLMAAGVATSLLMTALLWKMQHERHQLNKVKNGTRTTTRLLGLFLCSAEEQDNVIGDLTEEYAQFESKAKAYFWLSKQVVKSLLPLAYKNLKSRLAYYLGERVR